jgi:uncharacterized NAD(P)/FAD-binding protein YdhS
VTHEANVVIVGGGPAGTHVLAALAQRRQAPARRIVVIERGSELGPGLPYGEAADPRHTLGRVPARRRARGRVLRAQVERACEVLAERGSAVELWRDTTARSLRRAGGGWTVDTDRAAISSEHVVLATGHWHVNRLAGVERAVDWRWDARRLHAAIRDVEDVVVLGTSQSAVDIALALAERRGRVTLASRRGLLPSVWGPVRATRPARRLARLRDRAQVRLRDVFDAIRAELGDEPCERLDGDPWTARDGTATLRRDLAAALDARRCEREIPWQAVLWPTVPVVFDLFPRLVAEDRLALAPRWYLFLRYLEAIHVANARRILELVDAGRIRVCALGRDTAIVEDAHGVTASGELGDARGHRIVDARGHDPRIASSDDTFLRGVLASGVAVPARAPFLAGGSYLETGGLWVDPASFRVRDDLGRTGTLYALGPLTMGQFPVYLGLWALRRAAALIAGQL